MNSIPPNDPQQDPHEIVIELAEEQLSVTREQVSDGRVRVTRSTVEHDEAINLLLNRERVEVVHVAKGQRIEEMPEIREENGVLIVPVVEEEIEVIRRLVLREELHIRKISEQVPYEDVVTLRKQQVSVDKKEDEI